MPGLFSTIPSRHGGRVFFPPSFSQISVLSDLDHVGDFPAQRVAMTPFRCTLPLVKRPFFITYVFVQKTLADHFPCRSKTDANVVWYGLLSRTSPLQRLQLPRVPGAKVRGEAAVVTHISLSAPLGRFHCRERGRRIACSGSKSPRYPRGPLPSLVFWGSKALTPPLSQQRK